MAAKGNSSQIPSDEIACSRFSLRVEESAGKAQKCNQEGVVIGPHLRKSWADSKGMGR